MKSRLLEIDERTEKLQRMMRREKNKAADFQHRFELSLIYHENALEGIVFSSNELMSALDPNAIAADASMVPIFTEIRNHRSALAFIREEAANKKGKITVTLIKKIYEILGQGIPEREKALYRRDMPLHRTYFHDIAQPNKAATLQWQFMQAFPFTDNSGKVARLLSHLMLLRIGYLPPVIHAIDRQRYYESLRMPVATLRQLITEAMENSLENAFKFFAPAENIKLPRASNG
jgi:Fic family protein